MSFRPYISLRGHDSRPNPKADPSTLNYRRNARPFNSPLKTERRFYSKQVVCKRKRFIRLCCPHCDAKCLTFVDYQNHLYSETHKKALEKQISRMKREVNLKREEQEVAQLAADKASQIRGTLSTDVMYCSVCAVNFSQEESQHISSKLHRALEELLEPKCKVCQYQARDLVDYEYHICSLNHVKKEEIYSNQQKSEKASISIKGKMSTMPSSTLGMSEEILPPETDEKPPSSEEKPEQIPTSIEDSEDKMNSGSTGEPPGKPKQPSGGNADAANSVITKVEALYCSCCKVYFSCQEGQEEAKVKHCDSSQHKGMWIKYIEEKHKASEALKE